MPDHTQADYLMPCGCPHPDPDHKPGCWMAEAEAIASEAADAAKAFEPPRHRTAAAVTALAEAGHLREVASDDELFTLLDLLTDVGLLGPLPMETSS